MVLAEEITLTPGLLEIFLNANVLVTGGTGSFGKAFIRALLDIGVPDANSNQENSSPSQGPRRIIIFSRDELKQSEMESALAEHPNKRKLRFFLGDVRDADRLQHAFYGIDIVIHAAALKQVPAIEYNPFEAVKTNILGAQNIITAAIDNNVKRVVALSTDKACTPVNLYGATKLASDKLFIAANALVGPRETRFSVVRYGNVFGSRGSVVPVFLEKVRQGVKSLPITDDAMTRFSISLPQACNLVLEALEHSQGGEMFVPRIPSYRIGSLVDAIAGVDYPRHIVGIRPGEKMHEMMIPPDEAHNTRQYAHYYIVFPAISFSKSTDARVATFKAAGEPVPHSFSYTSDTNADWVRPAELRKQVRAAHRLFYGTPMPKAWEMCPGSEVVDAVREDGASSPAIAFRAVIGAQPVTSEHDVEAVSNTLRSPLLTTGPKVVEFEHALCETMHSQFAVTVCNGTAALHCAYAALCAGFEGKDGRASWQPFEWSAHDAVIVPAVTFAATANAVKYLGAVPVFCDVDPDSLLVDVADVERKIVAARGAGLTVRAIVCVDFAGQPGPLREMRAVADRFECAFIIDAAHSVGAKYAGGYEASFADVITLSFHPVKTITTGEGGAIITNDEAIASRARQFRQHGMGTTYQQREASNALVSDQSILGFNYRLSDIHCSLGISQLSQLNSFLGSRQRVASWYATHLATTVFRSDVSVIPMKQLDDTSVNAYHLFVVRLKGVNAAIAGGRDAIFREMKKRGCDVKLHYIPVFRHSYYKLHEGDSLHHLGHDACPAAELAADEILSLPMWVGLVEEDIRHVVLSLKECLEA